MSAVLDFCLSRIRFRLRPYRPPHVSPRVCPPGQMFYELPRYTVLPSGRGISLSQQLPSLLGL